MADSETSAPRKIVARSIRDQVYEQLKTLIVQGHFGAEDRFDLNRLSRDLGVSKTPLNEAIQKLESEGLLTIRPRSGTYVNTVDETEFREAFELRRMLEIGATDFVMDRITDAEIAEIAQIAARMETLLNTGPYHEIIRDFIALDDRLHSAIIAASRHRMLIDTYGRINTLLLVSKVRGKFRREDSLGTLAEHRALCAALAARDRDAYRRAIEAHMSGAIDRLTCAMRGAMRDRDRP